MMMHRVEQFRNKLLGGEQTIGAILDFNGWQLLRGLRAVPRLDFVWIDMEHGVSDRESAYKAVDTMSELRAIPFVRASSTEPTVIKLALDLGVGGIILPHVDTVDQMKGAVAQCLYPPRGVRSMGPNFAANQWMLPGAEYVRKANEHLVIVAQIEHVDAVRTIDAICSVERVDVIFIGRFDLSASIGFPGEVEHPEVVRVEQEIVTAARKAGKRVGTIAPQPALFRKTMAAGYDFVVTTSLMNFAVMGMNGFLEGSP